MQQLRRAAVVYVAVVTAAAIAALVAAVSYVATHPDGDEHAVRVIAVLAPIFVLSVYLKSRMTLEVDLSANVPVLIAAYLIGGWSVACIVGASAVVLDRHRGWSRLLFNNAQWVLMGLAGGLVYKALGGNTWQEPVQDITDELLPIIVSIVAVIAVNGISMSVAVNADFPASTDPVQNGIFSSHCGKSAVQRGITKAW